MMSQSSDLIFQWESHCACTLESPLFICPSTSIHAGTPDNMNTSEPLHTLFHARVLYLSLINAIAFINETQVFIFDNSNFINNPLYTSMYIQAMFHQKLPLFRGLPIYIYISLSHDCDMDLIGCFPMGTSIMYANSAVMHIMTYITLSWL